MFALMFVGLLCALLRFAQDLSLDCFMLKMDRRSLWQQKLPRVLCSFIRFELLPDLATGAICSASERTRGIKPQEVKGNPIAVQFPKLVFKHFEV